MYGRNIYNFVYLLIILFYFILIKIITGVRLLLLCYVKYVLCNPDRGSSYKDSVPGKCPLPKHKKKGLVESSNPDRGAATRTLSSGSAPKKNLGSVLSYINPWVVVKVNLLHMLGFLSASTVLGPGRFAHH